MVYDVCKNAFLLLVLLNMVLGTIGCFVLGASSYVARCRKYGRPKSSYFLLPFYCAFVPMALGVISFVDLFAEIKKRKV